MERFEDILQSLTDLERENDVSVLFACESGSRAWGFASPDSDFDVRFIYANRPEWYLSVDLERRRDVIEVPIAADLDISGWDLRKTLGLLAKSNPPLMEWLRSPVVYLDRYQTAAGLRDLIPGYFSPTSSAYHYLSMARKNYRAYLTSRKVRIKKYFYVLRPLLAVQWIEQDRGVVPTDFKTLVETLVKDASLKSAIEQLLELKMRTRESEHSEPIPILHGFIDSQLERLQSPRFEKHDVPIDLERLNRFFRSKLKEVWRDAWSP